jgi:dTDP-4-dehydrorhamnose reductase
MKLLVFGGAGQIGNALWPLAEAHDDLMVAPSREELDIRDWQRVERMIADSGADVVVNLTAYHVLNDCEAHFADAVDINCTSVWHMAKACSVSGGRFVTVSTDYVFDGASAQPYEEYDAANPIQAYGVSKRAGELAALTSDTALVVRTCGLYGHAGSRQRGGNFVEKRLADMAGNNSIGVGSDLICTPTSALSFARALYALASNRKATPGIYHLTAEGQCSWAEFTQEIAELAGASCAVEQVDRAGNYGTVRRPAYSVLANKRAAALGICLPHWREDLKEYMRRRASISQ